jgi:hypothetical protein
MSFVFLQNAQQLIKLGCLVIICNQVQVLKGRIRYNSVKTKKRRKMPVLSLGLALWGCMRCVVLSISPELAGKRLSPTIEFTSFLLVRFSLEPQGHHPSKEPFLRRKNLLGLAVNLRKLIMVLNYKMILYCFPPFLLSRPLRRKADRCATTN